MKKILAVLVAVAIVLSCTSTALAAETDKIDTGVYKSSIKVGTGTEYTYKGIVEKYPAAAQYIYNQLNNNYKNLIGSKINLIDYNLSVEDGCALYYGVIYENPDLYYVRPDDFSYSQNTSKTKLVAIYPSFIFSTLSEIEAAKKDMEKKIKQYLKGVDNNWSDLYKARYLHDLLATQVAYPEVDDQGYIVGEKENSWYWAYGALINSKAVCQGYTLAYEILLRRCGIYATAVPSDDMVHIWNMVTINGKNYHVDVTWDDPVNDNLGYVQHTYFMLSDDAFAAVDNGRHYGWIAEDATDTTYDNLWFKNVDTFIYYDSESEKDYYIEKTVGTNVGYFKSRDINSGEEETVYALNEKWTTKDGTNRFYKLSFTSLSKYDGYYYFNGINSVYKMKPEDNAPEPVFTIDNVYDIYGINITPDGYLNYTTKENRYEVDDVSTYDLKSEINRVLDAEVEIEGNDANYAMFGITQPEDGYTGLNLLGVQRKTVQENDSLRFISLVSTAALKNAREYGFVFTSTAKATSVAKERASVLTIENGHKYDCTGTINQMTGDYGSDDLDATSYKYVTAAINNITDDKAIVARFYFIDNDGLAHYGNYIDSNNNKWAGCAVRLSDLG